MSADIPQNHAEFIAVCQAKIRGQIKIGPAFPKIDEDTGTFKVAFKIARPTGSEWTVAELGASS